MAKINLICNKTHSRRKCPHCGRRVNGILMDFIKINKQHSNMETILFNISNNGVICIRKK